MVDKSGPSFCQGLHTKNGLDLLLAHGHGPVGLAKPYLIFYPLQLTLNYEPFIQNKILVFYYNAREKVRVTTKIYFSFFYKGPHLFSRKTNVVNIGVTSHINCTGSSFFFFFLSFFFPP